LIAWALCAVGAAQAPDFGAPFITNYEKDVYKAHGQNWVAVRDRRGILYFGNSNGILEFDGQKWRMASMASRNAVRALGMGLDGTLYYGSIGDLGVLDIAPTGEPVARSLVGSLPESERHFTDVLQVETTPEAIYFLTRTRTFRYAGGRFTFLPGRLPGTQSCVQDGTLFYFVESQGLCAVEGDRAVPLLVAQGKRVRGPSILAAFGNHELLVGQGASGFQRLDLGPLWDEGSRRYLPGRGIRLPVRAFPTDLDRFLGGDQADLFKVQPAGPGLFAAVTLKGGILLFDRAGRFQRAINKEGGLLENTVTSVLLEPSGDLWATLNTGLAHIELGVAQSQFGPWNGIQGMPLSVGSHGGHLYVGTFQSLFVEAPCRYSLEHPVPQFLPVVDGPREVWQFLEAEGDFLAGASHGLFRIEGTRAHRIQGSVDIACLSLGTSRRWPGHLFAGMQGGVDVFKRTKGSWTLLGHLAGIQDNIRHMAVDARGDLWLSTDIQGLLRVRFTGAGPLDVAVARFGEEDGLPGLKGINVAEVDGRILALTPQGIYTPVEGGARGVRFILDPGLKTALAAAGPEFLFSIADGRGGAIFGASQGLCRYVPGGDGGARVVFTPFQGGVEAHWRAFAREDGSFWLPGNRVYRIDLGAERLPDAGFSVQIRRVATRAKRLLPLGGKDLELPFRENSLAFDFSATSYRSAGRIQYQRLLEGFDREWSEWESDGFREYTNLPPGAYCFRVRARTPEGILGQEGRFTFRVRAPWFRTPIAYGGWAVLVCLIFAGGIRLNSRHLRAQKLRLEALVGRRTQELRALNERLYHLNDEKNRIIGVAAHDLRNPLSGILLACDDLEEAPEEDPLPTIQAIRRQGRRMLELIQGLLDVNAIEADSAELPSLAPLDPLPLIRSAAKAHAVRAQNKGIELVLDLPAAAHPVLGDARHFERVMDNLVSNAVKYSSSGSRVTLQVEEAEKGSLFSVIDQGPGLTLEDQKRLFQTYARLSAHPTGGESSVGLGLSIVKKLVDGMGGEVWAESQPGQGARFRVRLPRAPGAN
jgi:signal transduction histidine kinase